MSGPTILQLLNEAVLLFEEAHVESPRRTAEWLLQDVLSTSRAGIYAHATDEVDAKAIHRFRAYVQRRVHGEPVQYIQGHAEFFGLKLRVTPDVLIPRPETEEVVAAALACMEGTAEPAVLDVGTGSGCIALAISHQRPDAAVHACDVSEAALDVARTNAAACDVPVHFFRADVLADEFVDTAPADLDMLVSNPPYIPDDEAETLPEEVRRYEPHRALFTGKDPLVFYRRVARIGRSLVKPGGTLVLEMHAHFGPQVGAAFQEAGYDDVQRRDDLAGRNRILIAQR